MKKIYILLLASMVALGGFAQQKALKLSPKRAFTPTEAVKGDMPFKDTHKVKPVMPGMKMQRGPARVDVITDQPAGEVKVYQRAGGAFYSFWGYIFGAYQDGGALQIVYASDGKTVYIQDPVSQLAVGTWVKGELRMGAKGKIIAVPLDQYVYYYDSYGYGYKLAMIKMGTDEDGNLTYGKDETVTEATYTIDGDQISLDNSYGDFSTYECYGLGLVWSDDDSWTGYLDFSSVYTLFTDEAVTIPDGTELEDWSMTWVGDNGREGKMVKGAIVGDDVYVQGFSQYVPDGVMKGTISDGVVTFPSKQYIGMGSGSFMYMYGLVYENDGYYILDELTFDYDAANTTLTSREIMGVVAGSSIYEMYEEPIFNKYVDHAATPADPSVISFVDRGSAGGYNYGNFYIPLEDTEGNFINPDDVYYRIYVDYDELFVFGPGEYPNLTEDMTELAYNFTDSYDIATGGSQIYFYETGFWRIGIQSIFRGGGEEHASNIVYLDLRESNDPGDVKQIYSEFFGVEDFKYVGIVKAEGYDVAMKVDDASLEGKVVKGIRFRVPASEFNGTDFAGWLSNNLGIAERDGIGRADADITWKDVTVTDSVVEVIFDEPYTIGKDGFYAGYSFIIPELIDTYDSYPIVYTSATKDEGFWLHTSRTYRAWKDFSRNYGTTIELLLAGDNVYENAAVLAPKSTDYYVKVNEELNLDMTVYNHGTNDLGNITYTYDINGLSEPVEMTLDTPLSGDYYGRNTDVTVTLPAIDAAGEYKLYLNTTKANGEKNLDPCAEQVATVHVLDFVPTKRPLMEEYTGTWCGWCTRGLIAMREIAKKYGDAVVGVAYHNSDPMEIMSSSDYPSSVSGFPGAWVDRKYDVDPFYGLGSESFGITEVLDYQISQIAEAAISLDTKWADEAKTSIEATATASFIGNYSDDNYRFAFMLVEDDMYGEAGTNWDQSNYYASYADSYGSDPYLSEICNMASTIEGWHFDDVLISSTGNVEGSLPSAVKAGEYYTYTQTFEPDYLYNTSGEALVQNKDELYVVALVVNKTTGEVVNAIKAKVGESASVTELSNTDKQVESTRYYDLQGRQVTNPSGGIYIKSIRYTDGSQVTVKVLKK